MPPYKLKMCRNWESSGRCNFGAKCNFAHGASELSHGARELLCHSWVAEGRCTYGDDCRFQHQGYNKQQDMRCAMHAVDEGSRIELVALSTQACISIAD